MLRFATMPNAIAGARHKQQSKPNQWPRDPVAAAVTNTTKTQAVFNCLTSSVVDRAELILRPIRVDVVGGFPRECPEIALLVESRFFHEMPVPADPLEELEEK